MIPWSRDVTYEPLLISVLVEEKPLIGSLLLSYIKWRRPDLSADLDRGGRITTPSVVRFPHSLALLE